MEIKKYAFIDSLRGLAILGVIACHSIGKVAPSNLFLYNIMSYGAFGVQLFYIASALTLCLSWNARSRYEEQPIINFYIRRFFRIAPLFYLAIIFYGLSINNTSHWTPNGFQWWFIPCTFMFMHGLHPESIHSVVPGGWSIAVEMSFYFVFPFVVKYIRSIKSCLYFFVISIALYGVNKFILVPNLFDYPIDKKYIIQSFIFYNFFGQLPVFVVGIMSYFFFLKNASKKRNILLFILGIFIIIFSFLPIINFIPKHILAAFIFADFLLFLAIFPTVILVNPITIMLGKLSFGMYLVHFAIMNLFTAIKLEIYFHKSNISSIIYFLLVVFISAITSALLYKYVEKPGINLGKHLISKGLIPRSLLRKYRVEN